MRYIGRETSSQGKFLFRILCNLKNFGIGRMLVRKSYLDRWPEPSYYIIKQAFPDLTHPVSTIMKIMTWTCHTGLESNNRLSLMRRISKEGM